MFEPTYLFIDGGHLRKYYAEAVREWFQGEGDINFGAIKRHAGEALRLFYYDCIDDREGENEPERERIKQTNQEWLNSIREVAGAHVRLGSTTGRAKNRRQKGVDILLAIDMMNHTIRRNMKRAMLLTGDGDFTPLVENLVQMGMFVEVLGDQAHFSRELRKSADTSHPLSFNDYFKFSSTALQERFPLPNHRQIVYEAGYCIGEQVAAGRIGEIEVLMSVAAGEFFLFIPFLHGLKLHAHQINGRDPERLKLYVKLALG